MCSSKSIDQINLVERLNCLASGILFEALAETPPDRTRIQNFHTRNMLQQIFGAKTNSLHTNAFHFTEISFHAMQWEIHCEFDERPLIFIRLTEDFLARQTSPPRCSI